MNKALAVFTVLYVALLHYIDAETNILSLGKITSAVPFASFELYRFLFYLVIPLAVFAKGLDHRYLSVRQYTKRDWGLFISIALVSALACSLVRFIPVLQEYYPARTSLSAEERMTFIYQMLIWNLSWLPGWEFLHRYALLRAGEKLQPRFGWLVVPLLETLYHLTKPLPEALGMLVLSLFLTTWVKQKRSIVLPLFAHLIIEISLIIFLIV